MYPRRLSQAVAEEAFRVVRSLGCPVAERQGYLAASPSCTLDAVRSRMNGNSRRSRESRCAKVADRWSSGSKRDSTWASPASPARSRTIDGQRDSQARAVYFASDLRVVPITPVRLDLLTALNVRANGIGDFDSDRDCRSDVEA